jgi:uncharacterized protein (DUF58 family)
MLKQDCLVMLFSDLLADPDEVVQSLRRLRHGGHDVILFHILDEAEVQFPFDDLMELEDPETDESIQVDGRGYRDVYLDQLAAFREGFRRECFQSGIDYVPVDTSMPFDKALAEYLLRRRGK